MIVGIGVDVCEVARVERLMESTPRLLERLFTAQERGLPAESLAARFAAKEAVAKVLGAPGNLSWQDVWVERGPSGAPSLHVSGSVAARAAQAGVTTWHVSLSHDGGVALAMVVAEGRPSVG